MSANEPTTKQLVDLARKLERQLARRRKLNRQLAELEHEIQTTRKFLNDLTRPFAVESGELAITPAGCCAINAAVGGESHSGDCPRVRG